MIKLTIKAIFILTFVAIFMPHANAQIEASTDQYIEMDSTSLEVRIERTQEILKSVRTEMCDCCLIFNNDFACTVCDLIGADLPGSVIGEGSDIIAPGTPTATSD